MEIIRVQRCIVVATLAAAAMPMAWAKVSNTRLPAASASASQKNTLTKTVTTTTTTTTTHRSEPQLTKDEWNKAVAQLRAMHLRVPLDGFAPEKMNGSYYEKRGGEMHEAVDMLAPRNTPIHAVSDGTIAKLFHSRFGGTTIYQFDPQQRFVFYYAHLEKYADGLKEKQSVHRGDIIGFVGTSGNAPPNTPHLHLSISELGKEKRWWVAAPVDPYEVFRAP
jgi:murein DD-endopeptidase MepM/ murein hydrolase activator NlpD